MSAANGKYHVCVAWTQTETAHIVDMVAVRGMELVHWSMHSEYRSRQEYSLNEAQKVRDAAIRKGADASHVSIRY